MKFHHIGIVVNNIVNDGKIIENVLRSKKASIPFHDKIQKVRKNPGTRKRIYKWVKGKGP